MDTKEEMNSEGDDSVEEFVHESEITLIVDDIDIKHEEMDFHLHHNSSVSSTQTYSEDHSDLSYASMSSNVHVECGSLKAEEKDMKELCQDVLSYDRDCETCIKYMKMLSEHVRSTHAPHQPNQDPLLIDPVPAPLTDQSSLSIQSKSEVDENSVKMYCSDSENVSGGEFVHESETTSSIVDEIDIKHEDMDFHLHHNSTPDDHSEDHSDLRVETMSSIAHIECGHAKTEEKDLNDFYHDLLLCERDCKTCVNYMRMLSEHVRAIHTSPQPIHDPLLIDHDLLTDQSSSSIQIKSEVGENIVKMDCSDSEEVSAPNTDSDPDYNKESDSESDPDSDYAPSPALTRKVRLQGPAIANCHSSTQPRSPKSKKEILAAREHFKCEDCGKCFKRMVGLKEHMSVHTGEKRFKCNLCEKRFARSHQMIEHKKIHTGEKPFMCDVCEKGFARSSDLIVHKRFHSKERPFKCSVCEKSFTRKGNLNTHLRMHRGQDPFQCGVCKKSFPTWKILTSHKGIHTGEKPFMCNVCETGFTTKYNLTTHTRLHTGEKLFKCDLCVKSFPRKNDLITHKRNHTGDTPYQCDECEKSFTLKGHLSAHKQNHTKEKAFRLWERLRRISQDWVG